MKNRPKLNFKHAETNLETDIDESSPLCPFSRRLTAQKAKKKVKRTLKNSSTPTYYQVAQSWLRRSWGSNWSIWAAPWGFLATKRPVLICRSDSLENSTPWYVFGDEGGRQRCWDRWGSCGRWNRALLWLAQGGHRSQCRQPLEIALSFRRCMIIACFFSQFLFFAWGPQN